MFWETIDSASSTASTKFVEVQSDIEDAWNSLAELITNSIEQCECPRPSLNDVADDEDLCGLQFLDEEELLDGPRLITATKVWKWKSRRCKILHQISKFSQVG